MSLVIKLDETVTNTSILKLGDMKVNIKSDREGAGGITLQLINNGNCTVHIDGDGQFYSDGTYSQAIGKSLSFSGSTAVNNIYCGNGDYNVIFSDKYTIRQFGNNQPGKTETWRVTCDLSQFEYMNATFALLANNWVLKNITKRVINNCATINMASVIIDSDTLDSSLFSENTACTNLQLGFNTDIVTGNITDFGKMTTCTLFNFYNDTNLAGSYSDLADELFANGKHSGTCQIIDGIGSGSKLVTFTESGWTAA